MSVILPVESTVEIRKIVDDDSVKFAVEMYVEYVDVGYMHPSSFAAAAAVVVVVVVAVGVMPVVDRIACDDFERAFEAVVQVALVVVVDIELKLCMVEPVIACVLDDDDDENEHSIGR